MTKIRIAYGVAMVMTAAAFLWNGVYFALDVFLFQLALFLILKILLRLEMARLKFSVSLPAACACGQSVKLHISASNFFVLAAAIMEGDLVYENKMLGEETRSRFSVNLSSRRLTLSLDFKPEVCGSYLVRLEHVRCLDIFGLNSAPLPASVSRLITVYPKPITISFSSHTTPRGQMEEGSQSVNWKGSDASEVFDLRTYQPGDDIHTIHWKLSQKTDELLVRDPADSPRYDTLVLMDIGRFDHKIPQDPKQLSLTAALTLSISQAFLNYQLPHYIGTVVGGDLFITEIREQADLDRASDLWMSVTIPEEKGLGLRLLSMKALEFPCRRLFYLTAGGYPDEIDTLSPDLNVFAFSVHKSSSEAGMSRRGSRIFMNLSEDQLKKGSLNITL